MSRDSAGHQAATVKPAHCHIVAIIGARGGSKGLPRKNIRLLAGKTLIAWTVEAARSCRLIDRVVVSTDDDEIAAIASGCGAEVPFRRPAELAGDGVPSIAFLRHAVDWLESHDNYRVDIVVYLQPTDVFRKRYLLEETIGRLLANPALETVFVGYPTHKNFWKKDAAGYRRVGEREQQARQLKEPLYREDAGLACASRTEVIKSGRLVGERVDIVPNPDFCSSIDIHDEFDLWLAERIVAEGRRTIND